MSDIITRAALFAEVAHAAVGQVRKYTNEPYIVHPRAVACIVSGYLHLPDNITRLNQTIAAALLHDVVEDTAITIGMIEDNFGAVVAKLVHEVTDRSRPEDGNRAVRKAIDRGYIASASPLAKVIKLADMIDNARSIAAHDPHFSVVYLREMGALLDGPLLGSASEPLYELARRTLVACRDATGRR